MPDPIPQFNAQPVTYNPLGSGAPVAGSPVPVPKDPQPLWYASNNTLETSGDTFMSDPTKWQDPNAANIYAAIQSGANRADLSPLAQLTALGNAQTYGGANIAPQQMYGGTQLNMTQDQALQAAQNQQINQLYAQSQGAGPSPAMDAAKALAQQNTLNQMGVLASARGSSNPALAQRSAALQGAAANQQGVQSGMLGKVQEEANANQALGGLLGQSRNQGQTIGATQAGLIQNSQLANQQQYNAGAQAQAGLGQQAGLANVGAQNQLIAQAGTMAQQTSMQNLLAQLQAGQLNDQQYNAAVQQLQQESQTQTSNAVSQQQQAINEYQIEQELSKQFALQSQAQQMGLAGAGIGAAGAVAGGIISGVAGAIPSDRRLKTKIKTGKKEIKNFLNDVYKSRTI